MLNMIEIRTILSRFALTAERITAEFDTSHGENDRRFSYVLDNTYVLKVTSSGTMCEARLQEIRRLIGRYRAIGVYCPDLLPASDGTLSHSFEKDGKNYTCFVEEYAAQPILGDDAAVDRKEIIEHLGVLACAYTNVDLTKTKSMWSIIDLAPLDGDVDEKQGNADQLADALRENGFEKLAARIGQYNAMLREKIMAVFADLPRCVFQGDLNGTNVLHDGGHFAGLIDFNMAGTDVNINVFANETNCFPDDAAFDALPVAELLKKQENEQEELLSVILRHYPLCDAERYALPYYRRIVELFQYPNVCAMECWLFDAARREKCAELIGALIEKPL